MPDISQLSKGAKPQPHDPRDLQASFVMGAPAVDWSKEFRLPEPPNEDQGQSESCVAQSASYYHWQVHQLDWTRRDIYSQIFITPDGGAYLRDGVGTIVKKGQTTRDQAVDPNPETELSMRNRMGITPDMEKFGIEANYFAVNGKNIDVVAATIRDFKGCIIGVQGDNAGWQDIANPKPPVNADWGHALYCFGFHMHDGVKCIIAKSSWGNAGNTTVHHIRQNYFDSGNTFDGWTLIPKEQQIMSNKYVMFDQKSGREGILIVEVGYADAILWAKSQAMLADLKAQYEVPADAPVITLP